MKKTKILLVCFPKSGSTFISRSLAEYFNVPRHILHISPEVQELSDYKLRRTGFRGYIGQSHILPTKNNIDLIKKYNLKTVILERNVLDCLVSLKDMYVERITTQEGIWQNAFVSQFGYFDQNFLTISEAKQYDYLIETALAWYLKFYIAWRNRLIKETLSTIFINYETFFQSTDTGFQNLLEELNCYDSAKFNAFEFPDRKQGAQGVRFNVGRIGRGAELLSVAQQERVHEIAHILEQTNKCDLSQILGK